MVAYIDAYRDRFGVEPICRVLRREEYRIAPSTYYAARSRPPSARTVRDAFVDDEIVRVFKASGERSGARKVWWNLHRRKPYGRGAAAASMPRTRRQTAPPLRAHEDRARTSWRGRPPRAGHPLAAQDHSHVARVMAQAPPLSSDLARQDLGSYQEDGAV